MPKRSSEDKLALPASFLVGRSSAGRERTQVQKFTAEEPAKRTPSERKPTAKEKKQAEAEATLESGSPVERCRAVLDILRTNSKLERVYYEGAVRAFAFCRGYERTTEFRRLCEMPRPRCSPDPKARAPKATGPGSPRAARW